MPPPPSGRASCVTMSAASSRRRPEQELAASGALRELRRAAAAAVTWVEGAHGAARRRRAAASVKGSPGRAEHAERPTASPSCRRRRRDLVAPVDARVGDRVQHLRSPACRAAARAESRCRRRTARRRASGTPSSASRRARSSLHRLHVDRVEVGPLFAVDLDADEVLVHQRRDARRPRSDSCSITWHQ